MSYKDENGTKCACSRNRQCAFHKAQTKKMMRVAKPLHDAQKVEMGIEELRARYAKPAGHQRPNFPTPPRRRTANGWSGTTREQRGNV